MGLLGSLSVKELDKICDIYSKKGWNIDKRKHSQFDDYCTRASNLPDEEAKNLFFGLTERFYWMSGAQYPEMIIKTFNEFCTKYCDKSSKERIFVDKLIAPEDRYKTKSSGNVLYLFNDIQVQSALQIEGCKVEIIDGLYWNHKDKLYRNHKDKSYKYYKDKLNSKKAILLLVDDFVGTGDTAIKAVDFLVDKGVDKERIIVFTLIALERGVKNLTDQGIKIVAGKIMDRGISDYYKDPSIVKKKIKKMQEIEKGFDLGDKFKLGYKESEALVATIRTPNNTFPVFWKNRKNLDRAPFARGWDDE